MAYPDIYEDIQSAEKQKKAPPEADPKADLPPLGAQELLAKANSGFERAGGLTEEVRAQYQLAIKAADLAAKTDPSLVKQIEALMNEAERSIDRDLEIRIKQLSTERDALKLELTKAHPESVRQLDVLSQQWSREKMREGQLRIESQMAQVPFAAALVEKQAVLNKETAHPKHQAMQELNAKFLHLQEIEFAPTLARYSLAAALSANASKIEAAFNNGVKLASDQADAESQVEAERESARKLLQEILILQPSIRNDKNFLQLADHLKLKLPVEKDADPDPNDQILKQIATEVNKISAAMSLQNAKSAEQAFKDAVCLADKLELDKIEFTLEVVKRELAKLDNTPEGIARSVNLVELRKHLQAQRDLPIDIRLELAKFYIRSQRPTDAKELLESKELLEKHPELPKRPEYKAIKGFADEYCKSTLERAMTWAQQEGKGIISDLGSGGIAAWIYAANAEAAVAKRLVMAVGAGAITKPLLQGIMNEKPTGSDALWGAANASMFVAAGTAHRKLTSGMVAGIDETVLREQLAKHGIKESVLAEFAVKQDVRQVEAVGNLLKNLFGENIEVSALKAQAELLGISKAGLKQLDGMSGKDAVDVFTRLLKERAGVGLESSALNKAAVNLGASEASVKEIATTRKIEALSAVEGLLQNHIDDQRKLASEALSMATSYRRQGLLSEEQEMHNVYNLLQENIRATTGTRFGVINPNILDPRNIFTLNRDLNSFKSLSDLSARSFWNRYRVDAASIGLMSTMYRGAHNGYNVFVPDNLTGKTISPYDAASNTLTGAASDAAGGAFLIGQMRSTFGRGFANGSLANELAPVRAPWQQARSGVVSHLLLPGQSVSFLGTRIIGQAFSVVPKPILTGVALLSPALQHVPVLALQTKLLEDRLKYFDRPLADKNRPQEDDDDDDQEPIEYKRDKEDLERLLVELQIKRAEPPVNNK